MYERTYEQYGATRRPFAFAYCERRGDELARDAAALERDRDLGMMKLEHVADAPVVAAREAAVDLRLEAVRVRVVDDVDRRSGHGVEFDPVKPPRC